MSINKAKIKELVKVWEQPVKTEFCIFCGSRKIINKRTKSSTKGAYLGCKNCSSSCFLNTNESIAGYVAVVRLIKKFTPEYIKLLKRTIREEDESRMERAENEILGID
jgi:transcription elongation factor Elf1